MPNIVTEDYILYLQKKNVFAIFKYKLSICRVEIIECFYHIEMIANNL